MQDFSDGGKCGERRLLVISGDAGEMPQLLAGLRGMHVLRVGTRAEAESVLEKASPEYLLADMRILKMPADAAERENTDFRHAYGHSGETVLYLKRYIRAHYREQLDLTRLAAVACLSPNYLCTLFRKVTGISLCKFVERVRMEKAAEILVTEDWDMPQVAASVGYRQPSYFCRCFRRTYGLTPGQYRARMWDRG